ncbi:ribulokinase [Flavobacterium weaverense]|uniref:L-ribulokinase n=1 Tax=Flavobacterium weaverense TaxID=271156 RepID=A0A3L9ZNY4_9FLAO|nr:ribulokinase [Flavobacterium weaverense]RMA73119.1 L-ribulokinase [Flavobacterium weaverense]
MSNNWVIGVDFGTAAVRGLLIDTSDGKELYSTEASYSRWEKGLYCDPINNSYRQHPRDYIEALILILSEISKYCGKEMIYNIKAISVDTTGSTPGPVDESGLPLALRDEFANNPNAMFYLWKDHSSKKESDEINILNAKNSHDYLKYSGGSYSSEWFWAKLIHAFRSDEKVRMATANWVEHCDWIPFLLTGGINHKEIKRGSCAAGHKGLWSEDVNPKKLLEFMQQIEPKLKKFQDPLYTQVYPATYAAGKLNIEWANKFGLHTDILVGIGSLDAHAGAIGGEISKNKLIKVMGTSTCDMMVAVNEELSKIFIKGISGQANDSIIPGMIGLEAGQSAFGDAFDWFAKIITKPTKDIIRNCDFINSDKKTKLIKTIENEIFKELEKGVAKIKLETSSPQALDWLNGRRTPDNNPDVMASFFNLQLSTDVFQLYLALIESTCFGARRIVETFNNQGLKIDGVIGLGGISHKSSFIMQFMADSLGIPIKIHASLNTCALGAAMYGAVVAGIHSTVVDSQLAMGSGFIHTYYPQDTRAALLEKRYQKYLIRGSFEEQANLS